MSTPSKPIVQTCGCCSAGCRCWACKPLVAPEDADEKVRANFVETNAAKIAEGAFATRCDWHRAALGEKDDYYHDDRVLARMRAKLRKRQGPEETAEERRERARVNNMRLREYDNPRNAHLRALCSYCGEPAGSALCQRSHA